MASMDGWFKRELKWSKKCTVCGSDVLEGAAGWIRKGPRYWEVMCDSCHTRLEAMSDTAPEAATPPPTKDDLKSMIEAIDASVGVEPKPDSAHIHMSDDTRDMLRAMAEDIARQTISAIDEKVVSETMEETGFGAKPIPKTEPAVGSMAWIMANAKWKM